MLAQNFKSAAELGIPQAHYDVLVEVLHMLERGEIRHIEVPDGLWKSASDGEFCGLFNMSVWVSAGPCGTAACLGGTAELISGLKFGDDMQTRGLERLFYPWSIDMDKVTPEMGAIALRNYLTTGSPRWREAVKLGRVANTLIIDGTA
jgi:hypothetical protein